MFWGFLLLSALGLTFVKLGSYSVWVVIFSTMLKMALIVIAILVAFLIWTKVIKKKEPSIALLGVHRSSYYYQERVNSTKQSIKANIVDIFEEIPIYGAAKVHQQLLENGVKVSLNTVASYRQELGLKAVLAHKTNQGQAPACLTQSLDSRSVT